MLIVLSLALHFVFSLVFYPQINIRKHWHRIFFFGPLLAGSDIKPFVYQQDVSRKMIYAVFPAVFVSQEKIKLTGLSELSIFEENLQKPSGIISFAKKNPYIYLYSGRALLIPEDIPDLGFLGRAYQRKDILLKTLVSKEGSVVLFRNFSLADSAYSFVNISRFLRNMLLEPEGRKMWTSMRILL